MIMENQNHKAIPNGYMTVGELAKKMGVTVRALHHYDKLGLLSPAAESDGGYRLYTDKDVVKLHQILAMKSLGFSLDAIKNWVIHLETPEEVADALTEQAAAIREKIQSLSEIVEHIEKLKDETLAMQTVNFRKYADILSLLRNGNRDYWIVKCFSDEMWDHVCERFENEDRAQDYIDRQKKFFAEMIELERLGVAPDSEQGIAAGKRWCELLEEFTGGKTDILPEMFEFSKKQNLWGEEWGDLWSRSEEYIKAAISAYVKSIGYDPLSVLDEMSEAR